MAYIKERVDYYVSRLESMNYYLARSQGTPESQTRYMISASDWRRAVIITAKTTACFRLDFLVVDQHDSAHMGEEEFVAHLEAGMP